VQLIKSARSILLASGLCYSFVIGVFQHLGPKFRVGRSRYIVSEAVDWADCPRIFPGFYWCLCSGGSDNRMLGRDDTLKVPTKKTKSAMYAHIRKIPFSRSLACSSHSPHP
jgi:hypothetical protein